MKNYKQILEAINRGIQFALDDFEPEDIQVSKPKQETITKEDSLYQNLKLREYVVDLGLPSGTFWCKYNLGCDYEKLNNSIIENSNPKDWYGDYYAWGELEGNKTKNGESYFNWDNYKFGTKYLTKYCNISGYGNGFTDNLTELLPEDDAAYQNIKLYNYKFHIPTKEQYEELINYTNNYWVNNYDPNKIKHNPEDDGGIQWLNGRVFEGKNKNQLFIPAAGYCGDSKICGVSSDCDLWSSSLKLDDPGKAYHLDVNYNNIRICKNNRTIGFSIRPVINFYKS